MKNRREVKSQFKPLCQSEAHEKMINTVIDYIYDDIKEGHGLNCENCKYFIHEKGDQPDGMTWQTIECEMGVWVMPMEIDWKKISCSEHELKVLEK